MSIRGIVIQETGTWTERDFSDDDGERLREMYEAIGAETVEAVEIASGGVAFLDEEGKFKARVLNARATAVANLSPTDFIVGPVVIFGAVDDKGGETSVTDAERDLLRTSMG